MCATPRPPRGRPRCNSCISEGPISPTGTRLLLRFRISAEGFSSASAQLGASSCSGSSVFLFPSRSGGGRGAPPHQQLLLSWRWALLAAIYPFQSMQSAWLPPSSQRRAEGAAALRQVDSQGEIRARREGPSKGRRRLGDGWRGGWGVLHTFL